MSRTATNLNPFQAPSIASPGVQAKTSQLPPLFTDRHIYLASFLGTPLAGSLLMARNHQRCQDSQSAAITVVGGLVATAAIIAVTMMFGELLPPTSGIFIGIGYGMVMQSIAKRVFGKRLEIAPAVSHGNWKAAGVAGLCLLGIVAMLAVVLSVSQA
ncbi:MAG: hypothetical protein AAGD07_15480 [Planctomycetota bacterium]